MLANDITQHKTTEKEREALQQQLIATQEEALRELSTPLVPIAAGVIAMPLVGKVDSRRAALIMETLLDGVVRHGAHSAILDITGVQTVDTAAANALVAAARACKLLGTRVAITGVRADVAQTLAGLDVELAASSRRARSRRGSPGRFAAEGNLARPPSYYFAVGWTGTPSCGRRRRTRRPIARRSRSMDYRSRGRYRRSS